MDQFTAADRDNLNRILQFVNGAHLNGPSLDEQLVSLRQDVANLAALVLKLTGGLTVTGTLTAKPTT